MYKGREYSELAITVWLLGLAICPSLPRPLKRLGGPFWGCTLGGPVTFVGPLPAARCILHPAPKLLPGSA